MPLTSTRVTMKMQVRGKAGRPHKRWRSDPPRNSDRSPAWVGMAQVGTWWGSSCKHGSARRIDLRASVPASDIHIDLVLSFFRLPSKWIEQELEAVLLNERYKPNCVGVIVRVGVPKFCTCRSNQFYCNDDDHRRGKLDPMPKCVKSERNPRPRIWTRVKTSQVRFDSTCLCRVTC